jgi:DNA-directed RNA polymerase specialized sigma24 family protein
MPDADRAGGGDRRVAELLAAAAAKAGRADGVVASASERTLREVEATASGFRAALCRNVIDVLDEREHLDDAAPAQAPAARTFLPSTDRWAGWVQSEPTPWPVGTEISRDDVLHALRRVPVGLRVLLVLRDAAGLAAEEAAPVVHRDAAQQRALLHRAREWYVEAMDAEVIRRGCL